MHRVIRCSLWLAILCLYAPSQRSAFAAHRHPPNIVFIMADDLGWADVGAFGSKYYETPNIDRLAAQGMKFTSYYTDQNCAPTRAALMSGQYAPRTGIYTVTSLARGEEQYRKMRVPNNVMQLPLDRVTVADALKAAGYATGLFGKWHLGEQGAYHPSKRGFDEAIVSAGRHVDFETNPKVDVPPGTYLADFLTDNALKFIERHKSQPFFLCLHHFGVHVPLEAKPELIEKFGKKPPVGGQKNPVYAAMLASVDESVGRVMAKLDELKLSHNTLVIFTSDNGGVGGYSAAGIRAQDITDNAPLRAGKGTLYEGGLRVPFIARWPGVVEPGGTSAEPIAHVDLFPTLLELAGATSRPKQPLDGVSFAPLLRDAQARVKREAIYWHFPGYLEGDGPGNWRTTPAGALRSGDWKLIEYFEDGRLELYNLKDDPGEKRNLAPELSDRAQALQGKLKAWRTELHAAMPELKQPGH
jgi:arylsulfatase A-like enzyme